MFKDYLAAHQPRMLIVSGKTDPFFTQKGVDYLVAEVPGTEVDLMDAGHFALETHAPEIAARSLAFLATL